MNAVVKNKSRKTFEICDGILLFLGIAFIIYPICMVLMGSPVVRLLGIMEQLRADVPVFLRVFFSLAPHFLSFYSLIFLFGILTIVSTLTARQGKVWAIHTVRVVGWIIGGVFVCMFGFWCVTALVVPEATAHLFAVEGTRQLVFLFFVGALILFSVLISLLISMKRIKRRWKEM